MVTDQLIHDMHCRQHLMTGLHAVKWSITHSGVMTEQCFRSNGLRLQSPFDLEI